MQGESFEEFKRSFSYGSRNDLNFKFLKSLPDEDAAEFFRRLLAALGSAYDTGDLDSLFDVAIEAQIAGYAPKDGDEPPRYLFDDGPFASLAGSVSDATVGMVTTTGHFMDGDDPAPLGSKGMTQQEAMDNISDLLRAAPVLSEIPRDADKGDLRVRHGGYDITSADLDPNVCFPCDVLLDLRDEGTIKAIASTHFSFPGATSQGRLRKAVPSWVERIRQEQVDIVLLVPV